MKNDCPRRWRSSADNGTVTEALTQAPTPGRSTPGDNDTPERAARQRKLTSTPNFGAVGLWIYFLDMNSKGTKINKLI